MKMGKNATKDEDQVADEQQQVSSKSNEVKQQKPQTD